MVDSGQVTMRARSGATYDLGVEWLDTPGGPRLLAVLAPGDLGALDTDELFHLVPAARPDGLALVSGLFTALELRPDEAIGDTAGRPASEWLTGHPERLWTDRWFVAGLSQLETDPPVRHATLWDYTEAVGPEADPSATLDAGMRFLGEQHPDLADGLSELGGLPALLGSVLGTPTDVDPLPALEALLAESDVEVERLDDGLALAFPAEGAWGSWICVAEVSQLAGSLVLHGLLPMDVDTARLAEAWELAGRFNADRVTGTVQVDADTGRTAVRTSLIVDTVPSPGVLRRLLSLNIEAMDEALVVFERFAEGASVAAALAD